MHLMKFKGVRELDAKDAADRAVMEAQRRRAGLIDLESAGEKFAVGGDGDCGCGPPPPQLCRPEAINDCYHEIASKYGCPLKVASGGQLTVAGGTVISFPVEPIQSNFFLPIALRLAVRDATNPDTRRFFRLTAVTVKNMPQENYHQPNPTAATLTGVDSAAYSDKTSGDMLAVPVAWGPFSRSAMAENLVLTGFSRYAPGVVIDIWADIWGYEIPQLPIGWHCGQHPVRPNSSTPNTPSSGIPVG